MRHRLFPAALSNQSELRQQALDRGCLLLGHAPSPNPDPVLVRKSLCPLGAGKGFWMKKQRSSEQIVSLLRQADVDLRKGVTVPDVCGRLGFSQQTYLPLADKVRRHGSESGQAASGTTEGELEAEEGRSGSGPRHADPERSRPPKLTCPDRSRRTVKSVRRHLRQKTFRKEGSVGCSASPGARSVTVQGRSTATANSWR